MTLRRRLEALETQAEKEVDSAGGYRTPPEVAIVCKMHERSAAVKEGRKPPPYTPEEVRELHLEDLETDAGRGTTGKLRDSPGWQSEGAQALLDEWQEAARKRLERIESGEDPADVYETM